MDPILSHSRVAAPGRAPERWLLLLHGIYGAGRNWGSIARRLVEARPEWGVVLVDLRMHGGSRGFSGPHTVAAAVLGHSFGGKVVLGYARQTPPGLSQVWVMDSTPAARVPDGSAWEMLEAVRALPDEFASRAEAAEGLMRRGYEEGVAQWMTINLEMVEAGRYRWRLDFDAMEEMLRDFFRTDLWEMVESPPEGVELHFVKATKSRTLDDEAAERVEAAGRATGRVFLHRLEGGHWINTDNPDGVLELLTRTLP